MATATHNEQRVKDLRGVSHQAWLNAHDKGQTHCGRLLSRGGRHENKRRKNDRRACRGRIQAE